MKRVFFKTFLFVYAITLFSVAGRTSIIDPDSLLSSEVSIEELSAKASQGDDKSQCNLAICYYKGDGVEKNYQVAYDWFMKSAEQGNSNAQWAVGRYYAVGEIVVEKDMTKAVHWYSKAAEQGHVKALNELSRCYMNGDGVLQDGKKAALLSVKASAYEGNSFSQYLLADWYDKGDGVPQDIAEAVKWYTKAAEQGQSAAQCNLGSMYYNGDGVEKNYQEAAKLFTKAAEQGVALAQYNLALMYEYGDGISCDYEQAFNWFMKAAKQGKADAQSKLGYYYAVGRYITKDYKQMAIWYIRAAEQGEPTAQFNLGKAYAMGQGVIEDYVEAYKWTLLAGMNGLDVLEFKIWLKDRMTADQISKGQELAKKFVTQKEQKENKFVDRKQECNSSISTFGSGYFISSEGYFVTVAHVVRDASSVKVHWKSNVNTAVTVFVDESLDVAVLKVVGAQGVRSLPLVGTSQVKTGEDVFTLGFPQIQLQGIEAKYTDGAISSLSGMGNDVKYFQISVPVQPGNSGGPLLDSHGNVVGMVSARLDAIATLQATGSLPQNVNYALKSSFILPLLESVPGIQLEKPVELNKAEAIDLAKNAVGLVVCVE